MVWSSGVTVIFSKDFYLVCLTVTFLFFAVFNYGVRACVRAKKKKKR